MRKNVEIGMITLSAKAQEFFDGLESRALTEENGIYYFLGEKLGDEKAVNEAFESFQDEYEEMMAKEWN